jgi:D-amino-acid dehydrogenase
MRVAVIGAGLVGVTTAYELSAAGHQVEVFERRSSVAAEASFAQAGVIAPAWVEPLGGCSPWRLGLATPTRWAWLGRAIAAHRERLLVSHRLALQRLALASRQRMLDLTRSIDLDFEQADGVLVLLRHERQLRAHRATLRRMAELGVAFDLVDAERARQIEPALNPAQPLRAAIHLPQDAVGNGRQFAHRLKALAVLKGAHFRFDTAVNSLRPGAPVTLVLADGSTVVADSVVVCAGVDAASLLASAGLTLPLRALWGVSVTAPVNHVDGQLPQAPRAGVIDATSGTVISRLGQRVRVSGGHTLGGMATTPPPLHTLRALYRTLGDWFPGSAIMREAVHWRGPRPVLPDGMPAIGASRLPGVWLNVGHGGHGWTLACGSARLIVAQLAGQAPDEALVPLSAARLR